jgi:hypothetical protein
MMGQTAHFMARKQKEKGSGREKDLTIPLKGTSSMV